MKIIIEHSKTKREINGAFNICGSTDDLRDLAEQIISQIGNKGAYGCTYGWIKIVEGRQESIANNKPVSWD